MTQLSLFYTIAKNRSRRSRPLLKNHEARLPKEVGEGYLDRLFIILSATVFKEERECDFSHAQVPKQTAAWI
jgi:hypothetical protein